MDETRPAALFAYALPPYPCPACRRERAPGEDDTPICKRCGVDLALCDAVRLEARALYRRGVYALASHPHQAEDLLRTSLRLVPHPSTERALAIAAARVGRPREALAHLRSGLEDQ